MELMEDGNDVVRNENFGYDTCCYILNQLDLELPHPLRLNLGGEGN